MSDEELKIHIKYGEGLYGFTKASIRELFGEEP